MSVALATSPQFTLDRSDKLPRIIAASFAVLPMLGVTIIWNTPIGLASRALEWYICVFRRNPSTEFERKHPLIPDEVIQ
jgi:hypothetical protein